ncbi:MAG: hypothetical protein KC731_27230, partial [Myxococcales bacterium]|nr:hypothetical protein [Myxococcales bacterium]
PGMQQPGMAGAAPGGAPHNPYAQAQSALATGSNTLKITQYALIGVGALTAISGLFWMIMGSFIGGLSTLITGVVLAVVAFTVLPQFMGMMKQSTAMVDGLAAKAQLAQTGLPATASVIAVQQTGRMVNYNPEVSATLQVTHPQTGASYQVQSTSVVPQIAIPQVQPGAQVPVRINPQNPMDVVLAL